MADFKLTQDMIGMNNYELYDPAWCDGHYCPRDCDHCQIAEKMMEDEDEDEK